MKPVMSVPDPFGLELFQLLALLPRSFRTRLHQRCQRASRYGGRQPSPLELWQLARKTGVEINTLESIRSRLARIDRQMAEARRGYTATRRKRHLDTIMRLRAMSPETKAMKRRVKTLERRLAYARAYAEIGMQIVDVVGWEVLKLVCGGDNALAARAKRLVEAAEQRLAMLIRSGKKIKEPYPHLAGISPTWSRETDVRKRVRELRQQANRGREHVARVVGAVGGPKLYASDVGVEASREQNRRTRRWAEASVAVNVGSGERLSMTEIMEHATTKRFNTLWSITKALEQYAVREGWTFVLITMTLPPEYHSRPKKGRNTWNPVYGPAHGAEELQRRWQVVRALQQRWGVFQCGVWTMEPHADGTPHRHAMVFVHPWELPKLMKSYRMAFPEPDGAGAVEEAQKTAKQAHEAAEGEREAARAAVEAAKVARKAVKAARALEKDQADGRGDAETMRSLVTEARQAAKAAAAGARLARDNSKAAIYAAAGADAALEAAEMAHDTALHSTKPGGVALNLKLWEERSLRADRASPATYIMKYIVKHLDADAERVSAKPGADGDRQQLENHERVQAWRRALSGKKSFDFFGLNDGTVSTWAAIANLRPDDPALADPLFAKVHAAIKERRGADALDLLNAVAIWRGGITDIGAIWSTPTSPQTPVFAGHAAFLTRHGDFQMRRVRLVSPHGGTIEKQDWRIEVGTAADGADGGSVTDVAIYPRAGAGAPETAGEPSGQKRALAARQGAGPKKPAPREKRGKRSPASRARRAASVGRPSAAP